MKCIKDYGKIAGPMTALLKKKNAWGWNAEADRAFKTLKRAMTRAQYWLSQTFLSHFLWSVMLVGPGSARY